MKVAVTGGAGFIGERLVVHHLARGDSVRVLTRGTGAQHRSMAGVLWHTGDLADPCSPLESFVEDIDVLYHCAGEIHNPSRMQAVHVDGTARLIEAAHGRIGRWVQLSSVGAYGPARAGDVTEDWPDAPVGPYESTKSIADQQVYTAARSGAFEAVVLRPSNVYGPTMRNQSLFQLISAVNRGLFFYIGRVGASANYVHVDNVVHALALCGMGPAAHGQTFIVSDYATLEDMVNWIAEALGCKSPALRMPEVLARLIAGTAGLVPGIPLTSSRVDAMTIRALYLTGKIASQLGYAPAIVLRDGLADVVEAWKVRARDVG
jgi:nucleoside-diphosphate-sugar epimerase